LDGSTFAEHAIPVALGIAEQCRASLQLVHVAVTADLVHPFDTLRSLDSAVNQHVWKMHQYLGELVSQLARSASIEVSSKVVRGRGVAEHLQKFCHPPSDLIVMATHGRGALGRFWWGSFAHDLVRQSKVPLVVVRGSEDEVALKARAIDFLILPTDGSRDGEHALAALLDANLFPAARHTLLHVVRADLKVKFRQSLANAPPNLPPRWWVTALRRLYPLARSLRRHGRDVHTKIVRSGESVGQIVDDYARQSRADMVLVAVGRRSLMNRIVRPSASEYLFRLSDTPLMYMPAAMPVNQARG
jgi:nucleotide-binding universal stress UspA family protein